MENGETRVHALYGFPVSHSLSPLIFNTAFEKLGLNRTYTAIDVPPTQLKEAVEAARSPSFAGFNVTMPHKTRVIGLLDKLHPVAEQIGSVNTVTNTPKGLIGQSTDGEGAVRAMKSHGIDPEGRKVLILGAGGAAAAVIHQLAPDVEELRVLNRTAEKAKRLVDRVSGMAQAYSEELSRKSLEKAVKDVDLLVNATPIQTATLIRGLGASPDILPPGLWVFDLAYESPLEPIPNTRRVYPLEMLVQQAALSYEIWLGEPAPLELMRSVLVKHNGGDWK